MNIPELIEMQLKPQLKPVTMKTRCEHIAKAGFVTVDDRPATPEEIFNYSPTGELSQVFFWYRIAVVLLGEPV